VCALGERDCAAVAGGGETEAGVVRRSEQPVLQRRGVGERDDAAAADGGDGCERARPVPEHRRRRARLRPRSFAGGAHRAQPGDFAVPTDRLRVADGGGRPHWRVCEHRRQQAGGARPAGEEATAALDEAPYGALLLLSEPDRVEHDERVSRRERAGRHVAALCLGVVAVPAQQLGIGRQAVASGRQRRRSRRRVVGTTGRRVDERQHDVDDDDEYYQHDGRAQGGMEAPPRTGSSAHRSPA
jgi:hypothetical protein